MNTHGTEKNLVSRRDIVATLLGAAGVASVTMAMGRDGGPTLNAMSLPPGMRVQKTAFEWVDSIGTAADPKELRACLGSASKRIAIATGFWVNGDGGGGIFYWDSGKSTSSFDNGGTVIYVGDPDRGAAGGCWVRIYDGPLNVKWFGAKGDFTADDTPAIQQALNSLASSPITDKDGGTVFLPRGKYKLSQSTVSLEIKTHNLRLVGEGSYATHIESVASGHTLFKAKSSLNRDTSNTYFRRIAFENIAVKTAANSIAFDIALISYSSWTNVGVHLGNNSVAFYGTAAKGHSPYYNHWNNVSVGGSGASYSTNGCCAFKFVGDANSAINTVRAPNANTIVGGRLSWLQNGVIDKGEGNRWISNTLESVAYHFELGADTSVETGYLPGTTNHTLIIGTYSEKGLIWLKVFDSAAAVHAQPAVLTGMSIGNLEDYSKSTRFMIVQTNSKQQHAKNPGYIDYNSAQTILNSNEGLKLVTAATHPVAAIPSILLEQQKGTSGQKIQLANNSAFANSETLRVYNYTTAAKMLTCSAAGNLVGGQGVSGGSFTTAARKALPGAQLAPGTMVFDTSQNKPVWWTGSSWRDANGIVV